MESVECRKSKSYKACSDAVCDERFRSDYLSLAGKVMNSKEVPDKSYCSDKDVYRATTASLLSEKDLTTNGFGVDFMLRLNVSCFTSQQN